MVLNADQHGKQEDLLIIKAALSNFMYRCSHLQHGNTGMSSGPMAMTHSSMCSGCRTTLRVIRELKTSHAHRYANK